MIRKHLVMSAALWALVCAAWEIAEEAVRHDHR